MALSIHLKPSTTSLFQDLISQISDPLIVSSLQDLETKKKEKKGALNPY